MKICPQCNIRNFYCVESEILTWTWTKNVCSYFKGSKTIWAVQGHTDSIWKACASGTISHCDSVQYVFWMVKGSWHIGDWDFHIAYGWGKTANIKPTKYLSKYVTRATEQNFCGSVSLWKFPTKKYLSIKLSAALPSFWLGP